MIENQFIYEFFNIGAVNILHVKKYRPFLALSNIVRLIVFVSSFEAFSRRQPSRPRGSRSSSVSREDPPLPRIEARDGIVIVLFRASKLFRGLRHASFRVFASSSSSLSITDSLVQ